MQYLRAGPPCRSVATAKRALAARKITSSEYDDTVWALKQRQEQRLQREKQLLKQGLSTRAEFDAHALAIQAEYTGR
jgi:hypothetical protein